MEIDERVRSSTSRRRRLRWVGGLVGPDEYNGYVRLKRFPGWRCTSGAMAGACVKGRKEAAYSTYNG